MEQTVNAAQAAPVVEKTQETKKSFFGTFFGGSDEAKQKKAMARAMDQMIKNQKAFLKGYHDLVMKYDLDWMAVPAFVPIGRDTIPPEKLQRLQKTIQRALIQEHVRLDAKFQLIPRVDRKQKPVDGNPNP